MKVVVGRALRPELLERIDGSGAEAVVPEGTGALRRQLEDAEVAFDVSGEELVTHARRLRWAHYSAAGIDGALSNPVMVDLGATGVVITSARGLVGTPLAEQVFANLLALTRGVARAIREGVGANTREIRAGMVVLTGMTMGIVGLGGAGRGVAVRAEAFGMNVLSVGRDDPPAALHHLLAESDVVCICTPLTDQTRGLFDLDAFRRMKPTAILVNVARGAVVDDAALLTALEENLIAGAALDTPPIDPLPPGHPLWTLPNVVLTPHVAGASQLRDDDVVEAFVDNLSRFREGRALTGVYDPQLGY